MRATAVAFAGLLLLAALTPLAIAEPDRPDRSDMREAAREKAREHARDDMREHKREAAKSRGNATEFSFTADGVDRENRSYSIAGAGTLLCVSKTNDTSGVEQWHCRGRVNATLTDANGTQVKAGPVSVMLHAVQNETGAWNWHLMSLGHAKRAYAVFALRGDSAQEGADGLSLESGKGGLIAKKPQGEPRLKLRLSDAAASLG